MLDFAFAAPSPSTLPLDGRGEASWRRAERHARTRLSPDFVGKMGLERRIHQQTFLSPSMENVRSGIARVRSVPVASLRRAAETQPRPKPNPNFPTRNLELATELSAENAKGRDQRERESTHAAALRAAQQEVQVSKETLPSAKPDIALKASTGTLLGLSQAASGNVLALGFGDSALVSSDADLGGYFYEHQAGMAEVPVGDAAVAYPMAVASDDMACFSTPGALDCMVMDQNARQAQRAWFALSSTEQQSTPQPQAPIWSQALRQTLPSRSVCPWKVGSTAGVCVGEAATAWQRATAVMATAPNGMRYARTSYAERNPGGSTYRWVCTSGCEEGSGSPWDKSNMTSSESTYGRALAMHGDLLAVGSPSVFGNGRVEVYAAKGTPGPSGYGQQTWWSRVQYFPPPPAIGTEDIEYTGEGNFGAALSLSSKWLIIGAPGNSSVAALIRVYQVSGTSMSHFCEVKHPMAAVDSQFGASIAQSSHATYPWTIVLVGAPGENLAYSILLRDNPPMCKMHQVFEPPANDNDFTDRFGFSVAISRQFVFIGTPFYLRWYKDASGLLYTSTFCFPGSVREILGGSYPLPNRQLPQCRMCPRDKTSDGGTASVCKDCVTDSGDRIQIPEKSTLSYGCSYTCNSGYFGTSCLRCSEYAPSNSWIKAEHSEWVDDNANCLARCIGGYYQLPGGNGNATFRDGAWYVDIVCAKCPTAQNFATRTNVQWIAGSCEWECSTTFFEDDDTYCYKCSVLNERKGIQPPVNALFVDGLPVCEWAPKLGYNCTYDAVHNPSRECRQCENIPLNAEFASIVGADPLSKEQCNFECKEGFFGHPTYPAVCESCESLMTQYAKVSLPANALWDPNPSTCTADSWSCVPGFTKADRTLTSMRYCCPNVIPDSFPLATYQPCGRACNPGYRWNNATASCGVCVSDTPKQNHEWLIDCDFRCLCSKELGQKCYYGRHELGNCYPCDEYHDRQGNRPPHNAFWYVDPPVIDNALPKCDKMAWGCQTGTTKSEDANPPGCCPNSLPYSSVVAKTGDAAFRDTCNYACVNGYKWDGHFKNCTLYKDPELKIANSIWNYRTGVWDCLAGFVHLPRGQVQAQQCMECSVFASSEGWRLPQGARWLNASELRGIQCTNKAFKCTADKYVANSNAGLCCLSTNLPEKLLSHVNGEWDSTTCEYRCVKGLFPIKPTDTDSICQKCSEYLKTKNVPDLFLPLPPPLSTRPWCEGMPLGWCEGINPDGVTPTSCTASITINFIISGIRLQNFTARSAMAGSAVDVLLTALANILNVDRSLAVLAYVSEVKAIGNVGAGRRLLQKVAESRLKVGALLRYLNPVIASEGKDKLASSAATIVFNALDRAGYDASVVMDGNPVLGPSSEVWSCKEGFTRNHATGRCCASSFFRDPAGIDKSRYFWQADGCSYSCLDSFRGADCLSCSEFNKDKFKPDNSMWDDSSPSCTTWKCRTGYIRSATGFSCNSLKELENICSSNSRCATCVAQGNCVWCSGRCVPGQSNGTDAGCPFVNQVASPVCRCEARTCSQECLYDSCSKCIKDAYCGWCAGTQKCMLGSYYSPQAQLCPSGWSAGTYTQCGSAQNIWMVGLVSASVSILLVLLMCMHCILRVRAANRNAQRQPVVRFGSSPPVGSSANQVMHVKTHTFSPCNRICSLPRRALLVCALAMSCSLPLPPRLLQARARVDQCEGGVLPCHMSHVQAREIMARFLETFPTFKYEVSFGALCLNELMFSYACVCFCAHEHMGACRSTRKR